MPGIAPSISPISGDVLVNNFRKGNAKSSCVMPLKPEEASSSNVLASAKDVPVCFAAKSFVAMIRVSFMLI
jgi:hypothetical protein